MVEVQVNRIERNTGKAILADVLLSNGRTLQTWLPLSQITVGAPNSRGQRTVCMTDWIAREKGIAAQPVLPFDEEFSPYDAAGYGPAPAGYRWVDGGEEFDGEPTLERIPAPVRIPDDGTYTVEWADGHYRTLRVKTQPADAAFAPGEKLLQYLSGSDNERSYTSFAFIKRDGKVVIWKRFRDSDELVDAADILVADPDTAGEVFARRSGRCCKCGRKLTVPASLNRGMGPECAARRGLS